MAKDILSLARNQLSKRHFSSAIKLLNGREEIYEDNAEFYILLGIAYLYTGDAGTASSYFQRARRITVTNVTLLLGQAAVFLRRGLTDRALDYYLEVLDQDPGNKVAHNAMEFIRKEGDYNTICKMADTGELEKYYPPLGVNPNTIAVIVGSIVGFVIGVGIALTIMVTRPKVDYGRMDLSSFELTKEDSKNAVAADLSKVKVTYFLSSHEITQGYDAALKYFRTHRDNMAQIEINRLLHSNASDIVKEKAALLQEYLEEPGFDTITDVVDVKTAEKEPELYENCYVVWGGRVSNVTEYDEKYYCRFLVGYENMKNVDSVVDLHFDYIPHIESDQALKVLGRLHLTGDALSLQGIAVYQSVKGGL